MLSEELKHMDQVSCFKKKGETCKQQMASAALVVVDYLSTAYLEALLMDIPCICFFDPQSMCLNSDHVDFYEDLIKAKILHTCPNSASKHLLEVYRDPLLWWHRPDVREMKSRWLERNLGDAEILLADLLSLT